MIKLSRSEVMRRFANDFVNADEETVEAFSLFLSAARQILSTFQNGLERYGLSDGKMVILALLRFAPEYTLTPSELAERCEVTRGTITGLLDGLERSGLIERKSHPDDRRMLSIRLTQQGLDFFNEVVPQHFRRFGEMIKKADLTVEERQHFVASLQKIIQAIPALTEE